MMHVAPLVWEPANIGLFLLANVIIIGICGPKLMQEIRKGMFKRS